MLWTALADVRTLSVAGNSTIQARAEAAGVAVRAPVPFVEAVTVQTEARGTWNWVPDGSRIWPLVMPLPDAYTLSFRLSRFQLPDGVWLRIYPDGGGLDYRPLAS